MKRRHLPRLAGYWLAAILAMGAPVHADTPTPKEAGARPLLGAPHHHRDPTEVPLGPGGVTHGHPHVPVPPRART